MTSQIRDLVSLLVDGKYAEVADLTRRRRLDRESIERAIREYGRTLVLPPDSAFEELDVVGINNTDPPQYSVRMNLWTEEEGESDLSVDLTLIDQGNRYLIELNDIHVL